MANKAKELLENGTFGSSLRVVQMELEKKKELSLSSAENMRTQVLEPLTDFLSYQATNR